jgi:ribosomal protein L37AE/L43A
MSRYACRRCDWTPADSETPRVDLLEHSGDAEHPVCVVCGLSLERAELQACVPCLADLRVRLAGILELYALLPAELGHPTAAPMDASGAHRDDETALPGGRVLALLAPGSEGAQWRGRPRPTTLDKTPWRTEARLRHDGAIWSPDPTVQAAQAADLVWVERDRNDNDPTLTPSVAFELARWEDAIRAARHDPAAQAPPTVSGAVGYLTTTAGWAADYHPAFAELAEDVRNLHSALEEVTSRSNRPQIGAPCLECEADLHRQYGEEHWTCPRCRRQYDAASYWLSVRADLEKGA